MIEKKDKYGSEFCLNYRGGKIRIDKDVCATPEEVFYFLAKNYDKIYENSNPNSRNGNTINIYLNVRNELTMMYWDDNEKDCVRVNLSMLENS